MSIPNAITMHDQSGQESDGNDHKHNHATLVTLNLINNVFSA